MQTNDLKSTIKKFIISVNQDVPEDSIDENVDLFSSGLLNSLNLVQLMVLLSEKTDNEIDLSNLDFEKHSSITGLASLFTQSVISNGEEPVINIKAYTAKHETKVSAFNENMRKGGSPHGGHNSSIPKRFPPGYHPKLLSQQYLAFCKDNNVKGIYTLIYQDYLINNEIISIANYDYPVSLGIVNSKYAMVGALMLSDAQKKQPYLFDVGLGSKNNPSGLVEGAFGWTELKEVPLYIKIVKPYNFFKNLFKYSHSKLKNNLTNLMAHTGVGWLFINALKFKVPSQKSFVSIQSESVPSFSDWADRIWETSKEQYYLIPVKTNTVLNGLYPEQNEDYIKIKITCNAEIIGWAVLTKTRVIRKKNLGDLFVGIIVDCLATPGYETQVMNEASRMLKTLKVDIILSYNSHEKWGDSLMKLGYIKRDNNCYFSMSKKLGEKLGSDLDNYISKSHITFSDGDLLDDYIRS